MRMPLCRDEVWALRGGRGEMVGELWSCRSKLLQQCRTTEAKEGVSLLICSSVVGGCLPGAGTTGGPTVAAAPALQRALSPQFRRACQSSLPAGACATPTPNHHRNRRLIQTKPVNGPPTTASKLFDNNVRFFPVHIALGVWTGLERTPLAAPHGQCPPITGSRHNGVTGSSPRTS